MSKRRRQSDFAAHAQDMVRLFNRGHSVNAIAETYKTNWPMIKRILAKERIKPRSVEEATSLYWRNVAPAKHKPHKSGGLPEGTIATAYQGGTSINRLSAAYSLSAHQIRRVLDRAGVPLRKREAAQRAMWWQKTTEERRAATQAAAHVRHGKSKELVESLVPHLTPLEATWLEALSAEAETLGAIEPLYPLGELTLDLALPESKVALMVCDRHLVSRRVERRFASYADVLAEHGWVSVHLRRQDLASERIWMVMALLRRLALCRCTQAPPAFVGAPWAEAVGRAPKRCLAADAPLGSAASS